MKKQSIDRNIYNSIKYWTKLTPEHAIEKMKEYLETVRPVSKRTNQQSKALHVDCELIAEKLNLAGKDMRIVLKPQYSIPWTKDTIKEFMYKPFLKALYHKDSTKDLEKFGEIEKLHDVIMHELGEKHGIEYHSFPHDLKKQKEFEDSFNTKLEYPVEDIKLSQVGF